MKPRILLVDDDPLLLAGLKRQLRRHFRIETAPGGAEALALVQGEEPFMVVVSDYRMPGMNGNQFLAQVREISPDTIRIMLTGFADVGAAVDAINEGQIFRFLNKPCPSEV